MGVVFFMIFAGICIAIGIIPLIAGIVILVRRFIRKKKTGEKERKSLVLGLILTGLGFIFAGLPILYFIFLLVVNLLSVPMEMHDRYVESREEAYYDEYVDTGKVIELDKDDMSELVLEDKTYVYLESMFAGYKDQRRGEAVANVKWINSEDPGDSENSQGSGESGDSDKLLTLYSYGSDLTEGLLCLQEKIFCDKDKIDALKESYQKEEFEYTCEYFVQDAEGEDFRTRKTDFSDEIFFATADREETGLQKCSQKEFDRSKVRNKNVYYLTQDSKDGLFSCSFTVYLSGEEVYIMDLMPLYSEDPAIVDEVCHVTDPEMAEAFRALRKIKE